MQTVQLKYRTRTVLGKSAVRKLKNDQKERFIPAVVYGGEKNINISVPDKEFSNFWSKHKHSNVFYELVDETEGKKIPTLVKEIQTHPVSQKIQHVDFYELRADHKLRTKVQVKVKGTAVGVREGGILEHFLWDVSIECLPKDIPDQLEVDVSELAIGDSVEVKGLKIPAGVRLLDNPDEIVLSIGLPPKEEEVAAPVAVAGAEGAVAGAEGAVAAAPGAVPGAPGAAPGAPAAGAKPGAPAAGAKPGAPAAGAKPAPGKK